MCIYLYALKKKNGRKEVVKYNTKIWSIRLGMDFYWMTGALSCAIVTLFLWLYHCVLGKCASYSFILSFDFAVPHEFQWKEGLLLFTDWIIINLRAREIMWMCQIFYPRLPDNRCPIGTPRASLLLTLFLLLMFCDLYTRNVPGWTDRY